jgi:hypothetical protein
MHVRTVILVKKLGWFLLLSFIIFTRPVYSPFSTEGMNACVVSFGLLREILIARKREIISRGRLRDDPFLVAWFFLGVVVVVVIKSPGGSFRIVINEINQFATKINTSICITNAAFGEFKSPCALR